VYRIMGELSSCDCGDMDVRMRMMVQLHNATERFGHEPALLS